MARASGRPFCERMHEVSSSTLRQTVMDHALVVGATLRLTRLITNDSLGQWWVKGPLDVWMHADPAKERHERALVEHDEMVRHHGIELPAPAAPPPARRLRYHQYLAGLECPHCVGYWIGVAVTGSYLAARRNRRALSIWRTVAATLSLNTAVVAAGDAIDYWS